MHPDVTRALAAERVKDMRARVAARDLASAVRHRRHRAASATAVAEAPQAYPPARQPETLAHPVPTDSTLAGSVLTGPVPTDSALADSGGAGSVLAGPGAEPSRPAPEPAHAGAQPAHPAPCA